MADESKYPMDYRDNGGYETPPNVMDVPAVEGHTLSTEEFDETPVLPKQRASMSIKDAIVMASQVALAQSSVQTYYFTNILSNLFVKSKSSAAMKAFTDISTMDDIWNFLEGAFMSSLYDSDGPFIDETATVYYNNRLLGRPRIRMLKANRWIDRGTRALIIDFSLFNANANLFSIARYIISFTLFIWFILVPAERPDSRSN
ncbi:hypothetical protein COOONC_08938 [Cooperia oncophora]